MIYSSFIFTSSVLTSLLLPILQVTLVWKARNTFVGTRNKAFTDKMLNEWAGALGEDEAGVSIRAAFDKYDRDGSGGECFSIVAIVIVRTKF